MGHLHRLVRPRARRAGLLMLAGAFAAFGPGAAAIAASVEGDLGQREPVFRRSDADDDGLLLLDDLDDLDGDDPTTLDAETATTLEVGDAETIDADTATLGADTADSLISADATATLDSVGVSLAADTLDTLTGDSATGLSLDTASVLTTIDTTVATAGGGGTDGDTVSADASADAPSADTAPSAASRDDDTASSDTKGD